MPENSKTDKKVYSDPREEMLGVPYPNTKTYSKKRMPINTKQSLWEISKENT